MKGSTTSRDKLLAKILSIVKSNPGIRPSEINQRLKRAHSAHYRAILINQGLITKEKKGAGVYYYPTKA